MALIYCRECGKQISDKAKFCPHCGYPMDKGSMNMKNTPREPGTNAAAPDFSEAAAEPAAQEPARSDEPVRADEPAEMPAATTRNSGELPLLRNKKIIAAAAALLVLIFAAALVTVISNAHCDYGGCRNTRVKGGRCCATHTCAKSGCFNSKSADEFYCYVHRTDYSGAGYSGGYGSGSSGSSYESASSVLVFSDIDVSSNSSYTVCAGTLTNNGRKTYKFVEVKGAFTDSSGNVLDTDWTYAVGSEGLEPGESTSFRMSVPKNSSIRDCEVSILDYDT